jgi:DNA-binding transcriptional LysR family regulator
MEFQQLKTFCTVAKLLSFHKAADTLNYAQSTISAQIKALEDDLGVSLFNRLSKKITLTEAGTRFLNYANKILEIEKEAKTNLIGDNKSNTTINLEVSETIANFVLPPIINKFLSQHKNTDIIITNCDYQNLVKNLEKGITDIAIIIDESTSSKNLLVEFIGAEKLLFVTYPENPLTKMDELDIDLIKKQPILINKSNCAHIVLFKQLSSLGVVNPDKLIEFSSLETIKQTIQSGIGIALLPEISVAMEIALGRMAILPLLQEDPIEVPMLMVWHKNKWIDPVLQLFMETLRQTLAK